MKPDIKIDAEAGVIYGKRGRPVTHHNPQGYVQVRFKERYFGLAHRLIWESVHGPIPAGLQINHKNGVKSDNRIANLEAVTASENTLHAYRSGLARADGENNGRFSHGMDVGRFHRSRLTSATPEDA